VTNPRCNLEAKQTTTRKMKAGASKAAASANREYEKWLAGARKGVAATDEFLKHHAGTIAATVTAAVFVGAVAPFAGVVDSGEGQSGDASAKSHWWDGAGDFLADTAAGTVNGLASFGNAMLHHPGDVVMIAAGVVVLNASSTVEAGAVVIAVLPGGQAIAVPAAVVSAAGITAGVVLVGLGATGLTGHAATDDRITVMNSERSGLNGGKKGTGKGGRYNLSRPLSPNQMNQAIQRGRRLPVS
jgi:hypothetical protein